MEHSALKIVATREHQIYSERKGQLKINLLGMKGGRPYVNERLSRFSGESTSDWKGSERKDGSKINGRLEQSHCIPYLGRIVEKINQHVLGERPTREGAQAEVVDDITLDGESLNQFMRRANSLITSCGWCWIGLDVQAVPAGTVSQAVKEAEKLRPYWTLYNALEVVDWKIDSKGGIRWLITEGFIYKSSSPFVKAQRSMVRRLWEPGKVTNFVFKPDSKTEILSFEEIPLEISPGVALDLVPFVLKGEISGQPHQFDNLESVNRTIMDLESCNRSNFFNCVFPQPFVPATVLEMVKQQFEVNAEEAVSMIFGQGYPILLNPDDKEPGYMMPDASATGTMRTEIDSLKAAMFEVVGLMMQQNTRQVASAEAKAWDFLDVSQVMRERAELLEECEARAVAIMTTWDPTITPWEPKYNRNFDVGNFEQEIKSITEALMVSMPDELNRFLLGKLYERSKKIGTTALTEEQEKAISNAIQIFAPNAFMEGMPGGEGDDDGEGEGDGGGDSGDQGTVGARIDAVNRLAKAVNLGEISRAGAIAQLVLFLGVTSDQAGALIGATQAQPTPDV